VAHWGGGGEADAQKKIQTMGTRFFPRVKWPGCGADHPDPSSAKVKERVQLYRYSPSGPS